MTDEQTGALADVIIAARRWPAITEVQVMK
jgi:hypothetical protein